MAPTDPKRVPEARVETKVTLAPSESESKRLFGSLWNKTAIKGIVREVITPPKGSGKQAYLMVDWNIFGRTKLSEIKVGTVKLASDELPSPAPGMQGLETPSSSQNHDESTSNLISHNVEWVEGGSVLDLNGSVSKKLWFLLTSSGISITESNENSDLTPYNLFINLFPMSYLDIIVQMTNCNLE